MNIVLLGIQGSGKGTVVEGIKDQISFKYISTGSLLREEIASGSRLGKKVSIINQGKLVDDKTIMKVVSKNLKNVKEDNVIFDGFPRNVAQAKLLDKIAKVDLVIFLNLKEEIAVDRILNRLNCPGCGLITNVGKAPDGVCPACKTELVRRTDDNEEAIRVRFGLYFEQTYPLIDYYTKQNILFEVDASSTPEKVSKQVMEIIEKKKYEHNNKK